MQDIDSGIQACLKYTQNNYEDICLTVNSFYSEASELLNLYKSSKTKRLSKEERRKYPDLEDDAYEKLQYLYLIKDYFMFLTRFANGITLKSEQMLLIVKFNAFFDGAKVLSLEDDADEDDSLLGEFKEMGREFKEMFISSKKKLSKFSLRDYVNDQYGDEIEEGKIPNISSTVSAFGKTIKKDNLTQKQIEVEIVSKASAETIECQNCHSSLPNTAKFCPNCGTKIEVKGPAFCMNCGSLIKPGAKFCSKCGAKIN